MNLGTNGRTVPPDRGRGCRSPAPEV